MLLADFQIMEAMKNNLLTVTPLTDSMVQPASIDVYLGCEVVTYLDSDEPIDPLLPRKTKDTSHRVLGFDECYTLAPGEFILGCTQQRLTLSAMIAARVDGKSSLGRLGLVIHSTAGFIDPGFDGNITLEITNLNHRPIILHPGMPIGQLSIYRVSQVQRPYGSPGLNSHYQEQTGVGLPQPVRHP